MQRTCLAPPAPTEAAIWGAHDTAAAEAPSSAMADTSIPPKVAHLYYVPEPDALARAKRESE